VDEVGDRPDLTSVQEGKKKSDGGRGRKKWGDGNSRGDVGHRFKKKEPRTRSPVKREKVPDGTLNKKRMTCGDMRKRKAMEEPIKQVRGSNGAYVRARKNLWEFPFRRKRNPAQKTPKQERKSRGRQGGEGTVGKDG